MTEEITTYEQAQEYMEQVQRYGSVLGLDAMRELLRRLGDPQDQLKFVHIAGTNGKGSVLAYLSTILRCAGYRTGRYLSPTVFSELEKIQVNGRSVSKADFTVLLEQVRQAAEAMSAEGLAHPTPFEIETALAFLYFVKQSCDIVVLETGLGGREDATNVIKTAVLCVLASISMDHMAFLGDTLGKIAYEKAGIIKEKCPAVTIRQEPEAMEVIRHVCEERNSPLSVMDPDEIRGVRYGIEKQRFSYGGFDRLEISMAGTWQVENAALAVCAAKELDHSGFPVTEKQLRRGLMETGWKGRFTVLAKRPYFIIDGAHNRDAALRLAESVKFYFTNKKIITIMGILKDKEYEEVAAIMTPLATQVLTVTTPNNARALPAITLAETVRRFQPNVTAVDSLQEAVELSYLLADKDSVILAFGSLSYLGELTKIVQHRDRIRRDTHGRSEKD